MKRSEVIAKVVEIVTTPAAPAVVFRNNRTEARVGEIEDQLKVSGGGQVFEIDPIASVAVHDIVKRGGVSASASIVCHLRTNMATKPASVTEDNLHDQIDRIVNAILSAQIGASVSENYIDETADDRGLITYQLIFTVTTESSVTKA